MVRYYGYYSNKCRGQRKKAGSDLVVPTITESTASFVSRKSWTQLIQKIYEVTPLQCPKCQGRMRVIAFIEDDDVIGNFIIDESYSQLPQTDY